MRIAIFSEVYWPMVSGVSHSLQRLVAAMSARGHACRVYAPAYPLRGGEADRAEVWRSASRRFPIYPDINWAFPDRGHLEADVQGFAPDLVHVATEFAMGTAGLRSARAMGLPVVASAHTDYERYAAGYGLDWAMGLGWHYLRWFYGHAEVVLCPSRVYERHLNSRGVMDTGIWSRGVDGDRFAPAWRSAEFRAAHGVPADVPLVACVGRLAVEKNLRLLLEAWRRFKAGGSSARLMLVGAGPLAGEIAAGRHPGVILTGALTGAALSRAYASADCFVFPSSTETFGNVLLEAMASGLPAIAAAAGGVLEFAEHRHNAWLVAPDDSSALLAGIQTVLGSSALRERLAAGARATALARTWPAIFDDVERWYRTALADPHLRRLAA